jgi:hypothetical protein
MVRACRVEWVTVDLVALAKRIHEKPDSATEFEIKLLADAALQSGRKTTRYLDEVRVDAPQWRSAE